MSCIYAPTRISDCIQIVFLVIIFVRAGVRFVGCFALPCEYSAIPANGVDLGGMSLWERDSTGKTAYGLSVICKVSL